MSRNDRLRAHVCRNILTRLERKSQLGLLIDVGEVEYAVGEYHGLPGATAPQTHKLEIGADIKEYQKNMQSNQKLSAATSPHLWETRCPD